MSGLSVTVSGCLCSVAAAAAVPVPPSPCQALPIFLDKLVDPVSAVLLSVTVVLVIGEILPQAVCRS